MAEKDGKEDKTLAKLNEEFDKSASNYHKINCEKRTNLNLYLGHHFIKTTDELSRRLEKQGVDKSSRIRVTKNHIFKISDFIINAILGAGADHDVFPANESELQDQKAAEMHRAVLSEWKHKNSYKELVRRLVSDFVVDGEIATKVFWNPNMGETISEEEVFDEETGETKTQIQKSGDVEIEKIFAWDLIFPESAKTPDQALWIGYQKMMPTKRVKELAPDDIKDKIEDTSDRTFEIYDPTTGGYNHRKGMSLVREKYIKPCEEHPHGYFYMFNEDTVIHEGPLPKGHPFPIKIKGFIEVPTSPRSISIIRQLRPLQVNVNYGASQQIITQMTLGQDKLIMLGGADLSYQGSHRGVEKYKTNAIQAPTILAGRSGGQFVEAMQASIAEMYQIAGVPEIGAEKVNQMDPASALFKSVRDKQRFATYTEKFVEYTQDILEDVLTLKKMYMSDEQIVSVVGKVERVNIPEFKAAANIGYQIRVNEVDENETKIMGKHIELISMLQYGGNNMTPEMTALVGRNMPFLNKEEIFQEALIDYDTYKNIVLALDRGEQVPVMPFDNADYLLPKLTSRMRKADFRFLDEQIQLGYQGFIQQLQQVKAAQLQQLKMQQSQLIPTTGGNVPLPIYREVPKSNGGTKFERVQVPQDALEDLVAKLEQQGVLLDPVRRMEQATQANIAEIVNQGEQQALPNIAAS